MTHRSENYSPLHIKEVITLDKSQLITHVAASQDVCLIVLPLEHDLEPKDITSIFEEVGNQISESATLVTIGQTRDLVYAHAGLSRLQYQMWISIKQKTIQAKGNQALPNHHFGALIHTDYTGTLKHAVMRIEYTYCPACGKTTKDYGGKKHTYNSYGTLISDIWRDIDCNLDENLSIVYHRFADLFGIAPYSEMSVLDCRNLWALSSQIAERNGEYTPSTLWASHHPISDEDVSAGRLINNDCLSSLSELPDDSVDFAFIDPPYNLGKKYNSYSDDLSIQEYFEWCDRWIREISRTLKPGRTLAILNIPLWAIRHFLFMDTILEFQNWIAWDALSFPVRKIMPAHYSIVCFTKGPSRPLPGVTNEASKFELQSAGAVFDPYRPLQDGYCLRASCVRKRNKFGFTDRGELTDLWVDIHRLKHNSRRVDHPCQLPPQLMYRLIKIFTYTNEVVLDCFNGAGTTSLTSEQLGRQYIGIELSEKYHQIAQARHEELKLGIDPFRKAERKLTEKNSRVPRMKKRVYEVPKKTLQLEVRRVAKELDKLPSRDEMIEFGEYPIKYYDEYFVSWGEVCAAARHDGMSEIKVEKIDQSIPSSNDNAQSTQLSMFDRGHYDAKR